MDSSNNRFNKALKLNLISVYILGAVLVLNAFIFSSIEQGLGDLGRFATVAVLITILYFIPINKKIKAVLFSLVPIINATATFLEGGNVDFVEEHYLIFLSIIFIALYFDEKLILVMSGITNIIFIALYIIVPQNFLANANYEFSYFLAVILYINGSLFLLYVLTKWGNNAVQEANKSNEEASLATQRIQYIFENITSSAHILTSSANDLAVISDRSSKAIHDIARAIDDIASGANNQARDTVQSATSINEMGTIMDNQHDYFNTLNKAITLVDTLKNEGLEILTELVNNNEAHNQALESVSNTIANSNDGAKKIEVASQMIRSISEQTTLLALNASIEAARAGESGRGFAVVASEIGNLAEQSSQFTGEIDQLIKELSSKTNEAVTTMANVDSIVQNQTQSVVSTNEKFEGISQAVDEVHRVVSAINTQAKDMENRKNEIIGLIEQLSAISQENAASSEESLAFIEEQSTAMVEVAKASHTLQELALDIMDKLQ